MSWGLSVKQWPLCVRLGPLTNIDGSVTNALAVRLQLQDKQATLAEDVLKESCPVTPSSRTLNVCYKRITCTRRRQKNPASNKLPLLVDNRQPAQPYFTQK